MSPAERRRCKDIFEKHDHAFSVPCVRELHKDAHIQLKDMQNLRLCLDLCRSNESLIDQVEAAPRPTEPELVRSAAAARVAVETGLQTFQLHPTDLSGKRTMKGAELFSHVVSFVRRTSARDEQMAPSSYLDVEISKQQMQLLQPTAQDFVAREIMSHCHGEGAKQALAQRKLDALGNLRGSCGLANDAERMRRLKNQLDLAKSMAEINKLAAEEAAKNKSRATAQLIELGPIALKKLKENARDASKLTKDQIRAVAFTVFGGVQLKESDPKPVLVEKLTNLIQEQPSVIEAAEGALPSNPPSDKRPAVASSRVACPVRPKRKRKAQHLSEDESEDEEDESEDEMSGDEAQDGGGQMIANAGEDEDEGEDEGEEEFFDLHKIHNVRWFKRWAK